MNNPSKRSARRSFDEPYSGDKPGPLSRPLGTAGGEREKAPESTHADPGETPAETGAEEKERLIREALKAWAFARDERGLMTSLRAKLNELQALMEAMRRSRK